MKGILLLVLGICFVASVTAAASTDINFYFSGMIPASAMSGGDDYQEISQGGYEMSEYEYWTPEGADGTNPGDRQFFFNGFFAPNGTRIGETMGECYWINTDKLVCQWSILQTGTDNGIMIYQMVPHASTNPSAVAAIVGGTGLYARATGSCSIETDLTYQKFTYDCTVRY